MAPQITSQQIHEYLKATNWIVEKYSRSWYANYCHWKTHRRWLRYVGWHQEQEALEMEKFKFKIFGR